MVELSSGDSPPVIKTVEYLQPKNDFFVVMFPGAPASGRGMWVGAAEAEKRLGKDFLYEESISAPASIKGDRAKTERYARIADEVASRIGDRKKLIIIAHSLGGAESLMFLDKISEDYRFRGKNIDLVVFSPISYGKEGWKAVLGMAEGTARVLYQRDLFESHIAFPLPYVVAEKLSPIMSEKEGFRELVIKGDLRSEKISLFYQAVKSKESTFDAYTRMQRINVIDSKLTRQVLKGEQPSQGLLKKREKLIAPYIQVLLDAGQLDPGTQRVLRDLYNPDDKVSKLVLLSYLRAYVKRMFNMTYEGYTRVLKKTTKKLSQCGIKLHTHMVYLRDDKFVTSEQAKKTQSEVGIDDTVVIWVLGDAAHLTVAYHSNLMMNAVEEVTGRKLGS